MKPLLSASQCRAARAYLNLTLEQLGKAAAVNPQTIGKFERGLVAPHEKTLRTLVGAFYDMGLEVYGSMQPHGADFVHRGIRDFWDPHQRTQQLIRSRASQHVQPGVSK